jgi:hypothetical protein
MTISPQEKFESKVRLTIFKPVKADDKFNAVQLAKGIKVEMEHTNLKWVAKTIAKAHLAEFKDYYIALDKMEQQLRELHGVGEEEEPINNPSKSHVFILIYNEVFDLFKPFKRKVEKTKKWASIYLKSHPSVNLKNKLRQIDIRYKKLYPWFHPYAEINNLVGEEDLNLVVVSVGVE